MTDVVITPTQYVVDVTTRTIVVRIGAATGAGTGDVSGPSSAVSGNIAVFNGTTGKVIADSGVSTATIPSALPVPISEGGTNATTPAGALANLGADAAGTPRPPTAHASTHLSTGADSIPEFVGATAVADGLDGLVKKPLAGQEGLFLRGDATWATPAAGTGDVVGPAGAVDSNLAAFDGVTGKLIKDAGTSAANIPSALPVSIAEGGTGQTTAGAALTALGGDAAGTPRPPTAHASEHISTGSDPIALMQGATGAAAGLDGLVPPAAAGQQNYVLQGDATWVLPSGGDVVGPAGASDGNIATFDGVTGKLIQDSGIDTSTIPSALPVPIAEGGTGATTAPGALANLGADAAGTPRPPTLHASSHENGGLDEINVSNLAGLLADPQTPTAHASSHLSTGTDSIPEFQGATAVANGLDGLVKQPLAGDEGSYLRGDATWQTINTAGIPSALPVPIAEGGTGQTTAAAALAALGGDAAGTPRPPTTHASSHLSTGADSIPTFVGATALANGLDGLVTAPTAGQEALFLRGDATWAAPSVSGAVNVGQTLYVDGTYGNNATALPEDLTKPYLTIAAAIAASSAGDAIEVRPGVYTEENLSLPSGVALIGIGGWQVTEVGLHAAVNDIITVADESTIDGIAFRIPSTAGLAAVRYTGGGTPTFSIYNCNFYGDGGTGLGDGLVKAGAGKIIGAEIRGDVGGYNSLLRVSSGVLALESIHVPQSLGTIEKVALCEGTGRFQLVDLNAGNSNVVDAIYIDGTSTCIVFGINLFNVQNGVHVVSDGINVQILGGKIEQTGFSIIVDPGLTGSGSVFRVTANHQPEYSYPAAVTGADFGFLFFQAANDTTDSLQRAFGADIHFGFPERGSELVTGEGGPYTTGMRVFTTDNTASPTTDGGNFVDVTAAASSKTGSTFTFQGLGAGHAICWTSQRQDASAAFLQHFGLLMSQDVAGVGGEYVFELKTGLATWETVGVMAVSQSEGYRYANAVFIRSGSFEYIDLQIDSTIAWVSLPVNAVFGNWARVRCVTAATSLPTFEYMRLLTNSNSFNVQGQRFAAGLAKWVTVLPISSQRWSGSGLGNGTEAVGTGPTAWTHELDGAELNSAGDDAYVQLILPSNICTAFPLKVRLLYGYEALGASPPTLEIGAYVADVEGNLVADPAGGILPIARSAAATELTTARVPFTQALAGAALATEKVMRSEFGPIDIQAKYAGDLAFVRFTMTADGGGTDVLLYGVELEGVAYTDGITRRG